MIKCVDGDTVTGKKQNNGRYKKKSLSLPRDFRMTNVIEYSEIKHK